MVAWTTEYYSRAVLELRSQGLPPVAQPLLDAIGGIDVRASRLPAAALREAAAQVRVNRHQIDTVILRVRHDRAAAAREAGYRDVSVLLEDWQREEREAEQAFTSQVWAALEDPALADRTAQLVVRLAIRAHLAPLGDLLLRLSEWPQAALAWYCPPEGYHREDDDDRGIPVALAWRHIRTAPQPLQARVLRLPLRPDQRAAAEPFFIFSAATPTPPAALCRYQWTVGWEVDGAFARYGRSTEPTLAAARFGAATVIAEMLLHPKVIRLPISGRLLIPRTAADPLDAEARVIDREAGRTVTQPAKAPAATMTDVCCGEKESRSRCRTRCSSNRPSRSRSGRITVARSSAIASTSAGSAERSAHSMGRPDSIPGGAWRGRIRSVLALVSMVGVSQWPAGTQQDRLPTGPAEPMTGPHRGCAQQRLHLPRAERVTSKRTGGRELTRRECRCRPRAASARARRTAPP
ncbi:hypothetical protein GCM10010404_91030 [Nonomuraea africana]